MATLAPGACHNCRCISTEGDQFCVRCGWSLQPLGARGGASVVANKYRLLREAGRGPRSVVALVQDEAGAFFALKEIKSGPESRERMMQGESVARALRHDHILTRQRLWASDDRTLSLMPWVEGVSLRELLESEGTLSAGEVVYVGQCIAAALSEAHSRDVLHGGVKPANILIDLSGTPFLTDFSSAMDDLFATQPTGEEWTRVTAYRSPEHLLGQSSATSDLFALGVICYEMLFGRRPFGDSAAAVAEAYGQKLVPPLRGVASVASPASSGAATPMLPSGLEEIVARMLRMNPAERWSSGAMLVAAFAVIPVPSGESSQKLLRERVARVRQRDALGEVLRGMMPFSSRSDVARRTPVPYADSSAAITAMSAALPRATHQNWQRWAAILLLASAGVAVLWTLMRTG